MNSFDNKAIQKKIGLFGTSANPPTFIGGHYSIIEWFAYNSQINFSEIWILPVYKHFYAEKSKLVDFNHRIKMCEINFKNLRNVYVKDYEKQVYKYYVKSLNHRLEDNIGTIDTIQFLKKKYQNYSFDLILGEDTYNDLSNNLWKEAENLKKMVNTFVVKRKNFKMITNNSDVLSLDSLKDLSSTKVRLNLEKSKVESYIKLEVFNYIKDHRLY